MEDRRKESWSCPGCFIKILKNSSYQHKKICARYLEALIVNPLNDKITIQEQTLIEIINDPQESNNKQSFSNQPGKIFQFFVKGNSFLLTLC